LFNPVDPLTNNPLPIGLGIGRFTIPTPVAGGFDTIRVTATAPDTSLEPAYIVDDVSWTLPSTRFAQLISSQFHFGARVDLTGPVGASVNVRDLYGHDIALGFTNIAADPDGNGVPNGNDGIGSIRLSGTDLRTSFTMWGGLWDDSTTADPTAEAFDGTGNYKTVDNILGDFDTMEQTGFGYIVVQQGTQFQVKGLPPGAGSVVIGSPWVRDNSSAGTYNPGGIIPGAGFGITTGFVRA